MNMEQANQQWATRPNDERYLSLEELKTAVNRRKRESWTAITSAKDLRVMANGDRIGVDVLDPVYNGARQVLPTHWAFGQLAAYAGAPAGYLRKLPAELAAINLQWGLEHNPVREDSLVLGQANGDNLLRSMTSTSYGRIWDSQVVEAVEKVNHDGRWQIPAASYKDADPRRATTLYASDRDVFIFLVDPERPIEVGADILFRGFMAWNSEVGSAVFGLTTFLYRYVCDNRIIWGATDVKELRIRHYGGAPERFAYEGERFLQRYSGESTVQTVEMIWKAKQWELPTTSVDKPETRWEKWLRERGFTAGQAKASVQSAQAEEGEARSLWDIVNGATAYARQIPHTDERVKVEAVAGKLMQVVA